MKLFAFDRDRTVDVAPPEDRRAVPLAWVRHLAHGTDHEVWAIGDQRLTEEAEIPGVAEALERHPDYAGDGRPAMVIPREERVRLVGELFPGAEQRIVVDDADLGHVPGWTHYAPWAFVTAVELGEVGVSVPPDADRTGGHGAGGDLTGRRDDGGDRTSGPGGRRDSTTRLGRVRNWLSDRLP